ncbi:MAG: hypothetical protein GWP59_09120, partial [Chlamydiales bacterium]|nr:hypothetical protein [Chlamydiales bacterium]
MSELVTQTASLTSGAHRTLKRAYSESNVGASMNKKQAALSGLDIIELVKSALVSGAINRAENERLQHVLKDQESQSALQARMIIMHDEKVTELEENILYLKKAIEGFLAEKFATE